MWKCPYCGYINEDDSKRCERCGKKRPLFYSLFYPKYHLRLEGPEIPIESNVLTKKEKVRILGKKAKKFLWRGPSPDETPGFFLPEGKGKILLDPLVENDPLGNYTLINDLKAQARQWGYPNAKIELVENLEGYLKKRGILKGSGTNKIIDFTVLQKMSDDKIKKSQGKKEEKKQEGWTPEKVEKIAEGGGDLPPSELDNLDLYPITRWTKFKAFFGIGRLAHDRKKEKKWGKFQKELERTKKESEKSWEGWKKFTPVTPEKVEKIAEEGTPFKTFGKKELGKYAKRLLSSSRPESRERGKALAEQYKKWFTRGKSPNEAAKKALASVQMATARRHLKERTEEEVERIRELEEKEKLSKEEEKEHRRLKHWDRVLGHALTKHQEGQKYTTNIGTRPPKPKVIGEHGGAPVGKFGKMVGGRLPVGATKVGGPIQRGAAGGQNPPGGGKPPESLGGKEKPIILTPPTPPSSPEGPGESGTGGKPRCDICGKESDELRPFRTPQGVLKVCPDCYKKLEKSAKKEKGEGKPPEENPQFDPRLKVDIACPRCGASPVYVKLDANGNPIPGKLICPAYGYVFSTKRTGKLKTHIIHSALPSIVIAIMIAFGIMMAFGTAIGTVMLSAGIILVSMEKLFDPNGTGGYVKSVFRTFGFILIGLGFYMHFHTVPILKVVPLFVLAFELVTYPMPERVVTPEQKGLQIMRMILGFVLILVFYWTFIGLMAVSLYLFWSLILMSAAFFIAIPVSQSIGNSTVDNALNNIFKVGQAIGNGIARGMMKKAGVWSLSKVVEIGIFLLLFYLVVKIVIPFFGIPVNFSLGTPLGLLDVIKNPAGILDVLTGTMIGTLVLIAGLIHTARKPQDLNGLLLGVTGGAGIIAGSIALAGTTFAYFFFLIIASVGIIAAAPVVNARPVIGVPILFALIIASTAAYPDVMGESVFGIWWPKVDNAIDSITPMFEGISMPLQSIQQGFQVLSNPVAYYQNYQPQTSTKESVGAVEVTKVEPMGETTITMPSQKVVAMVTVENRGKEYGKDITLTPIKPVYAQGTVEGKPAGSVKINCNGVYKPNCSIDLLLPGEFRQYGIEYQIGEGKYLLRGNYITYGAYVSYDYSVNGKVGVSVMDKDYYYKLAENGKLSKQEQVTEDSGGPLRLGIAVMRNEMPVRDNMGGIPVMLYLNNQGRGTAKIKSAYIDISPLENKGEKIYCVAGSTSSVNKTLEGIKDKSIEPGKSLKGYCYSKIPNIDVDQKTFQLTGSVDYTYTDKEEKKMSVDFSSFYRCECVNNTEKEYILVKDCGDCSSSLCNQLFEGYTLNQCLGE